MNQIYFKFLTNENIMYFSMRETKMSGMMRDLIQMGHISIQECSTTLIENILTSYNMRPLTFTKDDYEKLSQN